MGTHIQDFATFTSKLAQQRTIQEEEERSAKQEEYAQFFKKLLQKYNVTSPSDLSDEKKKQFFDEVDKGWDGELTPSGEEMMNEGRNAFLVALHNAKTSGSAQFEFNGKTYTVKQDVHEEEQINTSKETEISEAEINSEDDFREYATIVLKKQHGDDFDPKKAEEVISDLISKKSDGEDWGTIIGMLNNG